MALIVTFQNDRTGTDEAANYIVKVYVNQRLIETTRIEGHLRQNDWRSLVRRLVSDDGTLNTLYCGHELVGGWCKRPKGHRGKCACS